MSEVVAGRYIVCGPAWYRIERVEGERVQTTVAAGSDAVAGRAVVWHLAELGATLRLGEGTVRDGPPPGALAALTE